MSRNAKPTAVAVADVLKQMKEQTRKRPLSVLFAGSPLENVAQLLESVLSTATGGARNIDVECCENPAEIVEAVNRGRFDLAVVYLDHISQANPAQYVDKLEIVRAIMESETINDAGTTAIAYLAKACATPVVVITNNEDETSTDRAREAGAVAVFQAQLGLESFVEELRQIVQLSESRRRTRPARIVIVDDDPESLEAIARLARRWRRSSKLLLFQDGKAAWNQLSSEAPDLLITTMNCPGMSGWKMLPLLAQRDVKYPVLVISEDARPSMLRVCAGSKLNVTFLARLGRGWEEDVIRYLSKEIGPGVQTEGGDQRGKSTRLSEGQEPSEIRDRLIGEPPMPNSGFIR